MIFIQFQGEIDAVGQRTVRHRLCHDCQSDRNQQYSWL